MSTACSTRAYRRAVVERRAQHRHLVVPRSRRPALRQRHRELSRAADVMKAALLTTIWLGRHGRHLLAGRRGASGDNTPDGMHALDTHTWGATLLKKWSRVSDANALARARDPVLLRHRQPTGLSGYTTFTPVDGYPSNTVKTPWYEGSFGVVLAHARARCLRRRRADADAGKRAQRPDGSYLYALQDDPGERHPRLALHHRLGLEHPRAVGRGHAQHARALAFDLTSLPAARLRNHRGPHHGVEWTGGSRSVDMLGTPLCC